MKKRKTIFRLSPLVISRCVVSLLFFSISTASAENEISFILPNKNNPYWNTLAQGIRDTGAARNVDVAVFQGESDTNAEEQLNICAIVLERKPKFVAMGAIKIQVGIECLKKATLAGIKVGGMDSTLPIEDARKGGVELSFAVGSDNYKIGERAAEYAANSLNGRPTQVLVIEGAVGSSAGVLRAKGFKDKLRQIAPQAIVVSSISAEWDRLRAMNITSDTIQRNPELGVVFAANDPMALGAVEALKSMNKLEQVAVIGVDGIADARKSILAGELRATVAQLPYLVGKRSVELALDILDGKQIPQSEITDTPVLTKSILEQQDAEAMRYVR